VPDVNDQIIAEYRAKEGKVGGPFDGASLSRASRVRRLTVVALVAVCCLLAGGCAFRSLAVPGNSPLRYRDEVFQNVVVKTGITYGSAVNVSGQTQKLLLDTYRPTGDTLTAGRPAVVFVHGGGFSAGNRTESDIVDQAASFAKRGYVTASIDYRLTGGCAPVTAQCATGIVQAKNDAQAAVRWFRTNAAGLGIDANRIAIAGSSAGAITAINVAYGADEVGTSGNPGVPSNVQAAVSLSGAGLTTVPDPGEPPTLFFHSTGDPVVPFAWAQSTIDQAKAAGDHVEVTTWPGNVHVPFSQHRDQILGETTSFLYYILDLGHAPT
jgi:acetyl esterase/lipase